MSGDTRWTGNRRDNRGKARATTAVTNTTKRSDALVTDSVRAAAARIGDGALVVLLVGLSSAQRQMAADTISDEAKRPIDMIDLSQVVSKYIGETEKNLYPVFAAASKSESILFFDEADALFGTRTTVKDAHDRYANIEVSHIQDLAQRYGVSVVVAISDADGTDVSRSRSIVVVDGTA
jgi:SpoVK/Ycf46/Vps4 family AAA+-type ATPase